MTEAIFRILPDWMLSIIVACFLWYGAHYMFLTDIIMRRQVAAAFAELGNKASAEDQCLLRIFPRFVAQNKAVFAMHTATFKLFPNDDNVAIGLDNRIVKECIK